MKNNCPVIIWDHGTGGSAYSPIRRLSPDDNMRRPLEVYARYGVAVVGIDGPLHGKRYEMVDRGYGRILNVASVASFQPVPGMATYAASKSYVLSLTEALSEELRGTGVTVTALCPGPTRTEMADAFADLDMAGWFLADPAGVAREGFDACRSGQVIRVPGIANQALVNWANYQPRWLLRTLGGVAARGAAMFRQTE